MKAIIIGGGIIGLCSAYYLQKSGWQVTVVDENDLTNNCSYGNAGMIVPSHFTPLASPGIITQGIKWMLDSKSPFYIKPSLSRDLIKWAITFIRHANKKNVEHAAPYLRDLSLLSSGLYQELSQQPGFDFALEQKGILMYFKTEKSREEELHLVERARSLGLNAEALSKKQIQLLEPDTELDILGAVHYHCDGHLYPNNLMKQLIHCIRENGGEVRANTKIVEMETVHGKIKSIRSSTEKIEGDIYVITGGCWLPELSKMVGVTVPIMPGKGYSFTQKTPAVKLNIPAILTEARVAITPMNGYMRFGGTMEIASVNKKVNMNRVKGIVDSIPEYFPGMRPELPDDKDIWFGYRPCSPDGMPYIGFSKKIKNMVIAGGHSMMGLGLGPATGRLVADLANDAPLPLKIDAFNPERFS
jgi:D-amino-acid dehydrogenase